MSEKREKGADVTAETITTIDRQRRPALWADIDRSTELVRRPGVMNGDWVIWGTLVLAGTVEAEIAAGKTEEQILDAYPTLPTGVVAVVRRWRLNMDLITALDDGVVEVLEHSVIELSPSDPPAIVYFARDHIAERGDWIVEDVASGRVDSLPRERLSSEVDKLRARWKRKEAIAGDDLNWSEWQRRTERPPGPEK